MPDQVPQGVSDHLYRVALDFPSFQQKELSQLSTVHPTYVYAWLTSLVKKGELRRERWNSRGYVYSWIND